MSYEEWVVRVVFPVENLAQAYEPLVRSGALLIGMGPGTVEAKTVAGRKRRPGPDLPEPATVSPVVRGIYSRAALDVLKTASWPGNIRQLEREMSRVALFLEDGDLLESTLLQGSLFDGAGFQDDNQSLKDLLENAERTAIERALIAADGDVTQTAESLEIGRSTLYRRMTALEIRDESRKNR